MLELATFLVHHTTEKVLDLSHTNDYLSNKLIELEELQRAEISLKKLNSTICILLSIKRILYTNNKATDLTWLKYFPNVEGVCFAHNNIQSLEWMEYIPHIKYLDISFNPIKNASCLSNFKDLREISLNNCRLSEFTINLLPELIIIHIENNQINYFEIQNTPKIHSINCSNNDIKKIFGLEKLTSLKQLYCNLNVDLSLDNLLMSSPQLLLEFLSCDRHLYYTIFTMCNMLNLVCLSFNPHVIYTKPFRQLNV